MPTLRVSEATHAAVKDYAWHLGILLGHPVSVDEALRKLLPPADPKDGNGEH